MQKLEQYYYGDASYFLNKDHTINIPSDDEILLGDSEGEDEDIFDEPSLTLISKNNDKGNNKGKRKIVVRKEKAVEASATDNLLGSLDIDKEIQFEFEKAIDSILREEFEKSSNRGAQL